MMYKEKATLTYNELEKKFMLIDSEGKFIAYVDAGTSEDEPDWELIEKQANVDGYTLEEGGK